MGTKQRIRPLVEHLEFRFDEPIDRFCDTYFVERAEARGIWKDLLRYLWLTAAVKEASTLEPPRIVDEMWHMFLVYTQEYEAWCRKFFGAFVHHQPRTTKQKRDLERLMRTPASPVLRERMTGSISTVWDQLGERVALRWYVKYPIKYDAKFYDHRKPLIEDAELKLPQPLIDRAMKT